MVHSQRLQVRPSRTSHENPNDTNMVDRSQAPKATMLEGGLRDVPLRHRSKC